MNAANRYAQVRAAFPGALKAQAQFTALWTWAYRNVDQAASCHLTVGGRLVRCLLGVERHSTEHREEHVSISMPGSGQVPTWEILLLVRVLAWPDEARVYQYFPAGDEKWVSIPGVEVLHLWRELR